MPISIACKCGQKFAAKDSLAGKTVKCPKCGQPLKIPKSGPDSAEAAVKESAPGLNSSNPLHDLLDEVGVTASATGRRCSECGADLTPEAIICIQCGFNTETGKQLKTKRDIRDGRW